ncbi:MAG: hypothetical protein HY716_12635 [Planctomycetes bacterium]|nr:hypothetical protein [Planctomycetota bacterium]
MHLSKSKAMPNKVWGDAGASTEGHRLTIHFDNGTAAGQDGGMTLGLRFGGWMLFAIGAAVFIVNGSFANIKSPITMVGLLAMPIGMILTMSSNILAWRVHMKALDRRSRLRRESPPPDLPPTSSTPEKHYAPRKLDEEKLKKDEPEEPKDA